ncbi:MAG: hypothetical protein KC731_10395, partial [Myxococcales bacterium]|nr:hypothetical protein [Myxococcales bacterium]
MNPASSIPYGTLTQTNPSHDSDRHRRWAALYEGDLTTDDKRDLLPRRLREPHALWLDRVRHGAEYIGYFGALVVAYAQTVCHAPLRVGLADGSEPDADYSAFAEQASEGGDSFAAIAESVLADALVHGRGYLAIDAPRAPDGVEVLSRAHEDALGLSRITADRVDPCAVIDWAAGADGYLDWCVIHRVVEPRDGARDVRDRVVEHFRYWYRDESTGLACWADYAITRKRTKRISPRAEVPLVDAGATSFLHVPMVPLVLKPAQWLGAKLAPLAGEVFRRRSELAAGMAHSIAATPVLKLGPEIPKMGEGLSEAQQDPHRGRNYGAVAGSGDALILGAEDDAKFLEPAGAAWKLGADEIRRLVGQGTQYHEVAVFYRANALSRPLEEALGARRIPYQL